MKIELQILFDTADGAKAEDILRDVFGNLHWTYTNADSERELTKLEADAMADGGKYYDSACGDGWTSELIMDTNA